MGTTTQWRTIQAVDLLQLRGNHQYGAPGSYGRANLPPWPSVVSGALRSRMLADQGVALEAFGRADTAPGGELTAVLGTPSEPGTFRLAWLSLARFTADQPAEVLLTCPADLAAGEGGGVVYAGPLDLPAGAGSSGGLSGVALARVQVDKKKAGRLLSGPGLVAYVNGQLPDEKQLVATDELYGLDERPGVGLDPAARSAAKGQLFTTVGVAFKPGCGLLAGVVGCNDSLPAEGLLRLGGDGRAASLGTAQVSFPTADLDQVGKDRRFRLLLTTPGCFRGGWLPLGVTGKPADGYRLQIAGLSARLRSFAAAGDPQVISGWNLATGKPKPAESFVPAGSVYWFDQVEGDASSLARLADEGLWAWAEDGAGGQRRAEGFNNALVAAWPTANCDSNDD